MNCLDPDEISPFYGYRRLEELGRPRDMVPCLAQFFESEKLRDTNETVRQEILHAPSPRVARKISRRHTSEWRTDWIKMRPRVFAAGLAMQIAQSKDIHAAARQTAAHALELSSQKQRAGGLPVSFISNVAHTLLSTSAQKTSIRIAILTLRRYVPTDLEARLDALFSNLLPLAAVTYSGNDASVVAERWCMRKAVPLRFVGEGSTRLRAQDHIGLLTRMTSMVVCGPQKQELMSILLATKKAKIKVVDLTRQTEPDDDLDLL